MNSSMLSFWAEWLRLIPAFLMSEPIFYFVALSVGFFVLGLILHIVRSAQ